MPVPYFDIPIDSSLTVIGVKALSLGFSFKEPILFGTSIPLSWLLITVLGC